MAKHLVFDTEQLHEICDEVNPIDAQQTVADLTAKLKKYDDLYILAAPQIGIKERVICVKYNDGVIKEYINPRILEASGYHFVREKDISIPEKTFIGVHPDKILVEYQLSDAKPEQNILKGEVAEVFDRAMNYILGMPLDEYGLEIDEDFDKASEEEQTEILDMYVKSLKKREELLDDNIEHDKDAKELKDAIRFMEAVDRGEVKLVDSATLK